MDGYTPTSTIQVHAAEPSADAVRYLQRRTTAKNLARQTGSREKTFFGNTIAYTMHLEKPVTDHAAH